MGMKLLMWFRRLQKKPMTHVLHDSNTRTRQQKAHHHTRHMRYRDVSKTGRYRECSIPAQNRLFQHMQCTSQHPCTWTHTVPSTQAKAILNQHVSIFSSKPQWCQHGVRQEFCSSGQQALRLCLVPCNILLHPSDEFSMQLGPVAKRKKTLHPSKKPRQNQALQATQGW